MRFLIATDSFKDALSALEAAQAIQRGLVEAAPAFKTTLFPLADGGEGTAQMLTFHAKGQMQKAVVKDPLFRDIEAQFGLSADGKTAFVDMAQASGIELLHPGERNPLFTTTFGTGQLMRHARSQGAEHLILGIGSSATNDGGMGMATALGYRFLDKAGQELQGIGQNLSQIARIVPPDQLDLPTIDVLCDVNNPLYGPQGAAYTYGPQKGADQQAVEELDAGLRNLAEKWPEAGQTIAQMPGAGAAGGMGFGSRAFLKGKLQPGIQTILERTHFEAQLRDCDWLLTGEGRIDQQTLHGKLVKGICSLAAKHQVPVIALCGSLEVGPEEIQAIGLRAAFSIQQSPKDLPTALQNTATDLELLAFNLGRLFPMKK